ncbi:MAG TPA: hypothetical protein VNH22_04845, partial [Blastocatellia bacterium]|nr:hypothetical protein [Blastocatellia bacterium]
MSVRDWQKIKDIFALALEQPKETRASFLRGVCGSDRTLLEEVESLLAASDEPEPLIDRKDYGVASVLNAGGAGYEGRVFGHYKIIREIGRGGMGAVFL